MEGREGREVLEGREGGVMEQGEGNDGGGRERSDGEE